MDNKEKAERLVDVVVEWKLGLRKLRGFNNLNSYAEKDLESRFKEVLNRWDIIEKEVSK